MTFQAIVLALAIVMALVQPCKFTISALVIMGLVFWSSLRRYTQ
jgi:hypothetical protein